MIPKSVGDLKVGDACFISRRDGRYVPFVFVGRRGNARAYLFGALITTAVEAPEIAQLPSRLVLGEHALVHIKCYKENAAPIIGNVLDHLDRAQLERITANIQCSAIGQVTRVWGWRTIGKKANELAA